MEEIEDNSVETPLISQGINSDFTNKDSTFDTDSHDNFLDENNSIANVVPFGFKHIPVQITGAWKAFEKPDDNYTRGCKWSSDGSCILTCSNDNRLKVFNFPDELCQETFNWSDVKEMSPVIECRDGGAIYDFTWYPLMSSYDPVTCCFCSSSYGNPVHMWDAFTGELRASYRSYSHVDEITSPHSVAFNSSGDKLYCGFSKNVRVFDVATPGRDFTLRPLYAKKCGQSGIISCFAFTPSNESISAAGSFGRTIGIYSEPDGFLEHLLPANTHGVSHLCFSPDGTKLYSGGRKDLEILCWDMRNLSRVLFTMRRLCLNNQRIYFDITKCGRYVISGGTNGIVTVWDTTVDGRDHPHSKNPVLEPVQFFQAHKDCVNGVSFHPTMPVIATCSGQRQFPELTDSDNEHEMFELKNSSIDNSLRLWWSSNLS